MKQLLFLVAIASVLSACSLPFGGKKQAALDVKSDQTLLIYLDDEHLGSTPYSNSDLKPGEYTLKLSPENRQDESWQTKVTLRAGLLTGVTRNFGANEDESSNLVYSLEPMGDKKRTEIAVVTVPDGVVVRLDDQPLGFSPIGEDEITPGGHEVVLTSPGYLSVGSPVNVIEGHRLTIVAKLAKDNKAVLGVEDEKEASASADEADVEEDEASDDKEATSSSTLDLPYVTVLETETGWLRVRSTPSSLEDNEVAKVDVGVSYPFVERNDSGWIMIEYATGKEGWVSGKYVEVYE